jgi:hypothetical protein
MKIAMWFSSAAFLLFGIWMTLLMEEGAHFLMHHGALDALLGFALIIVAPIPFLVCLFVASLIYFGDSVIPYDDGEES